MICPTQSAHFVYYVSTISLKFSIVSDKKIISPDKNKQINTKGNKSEYSSQQEKNIQ